MPRNKATLGYRAAFDDQNTKLFEYKNFNLTNGSPMVLEGLRDLTVLRQKACQKEGEEEDFAETVHRLEAYIALLHAFVDNQSSLMDAKTITQLCFDWTCPAYSSVNFQGLQGADMELCMALMLYAAALRQQADEHVIQCCDSSEDDVSEFNAAKQLFLRAAGVYTWILNNLLASKDAQEGKLRQHLPKLVKAAASACLGEAQAVVASMAEARKMLPGSVAALHCGASALFEEAAAALKPDPGSTASQRFRMLLALSSELHQVRARISIAANQSREGHPGAACADLLDARRRARDCSGPLETDLRWKEIFAYEQEVIDKKMADYDLERQIVSIERVSPHRSKAPDAKIMAKPTAYTPLPVTLNVFEAS